MRISSVVDTCPSLSHPQNKNYIKASSPKAFTAGPSLPGPLDAEASRRNQSALGHRDRPLSTGTEGRVEASPQLLGAVQPSPGGGSPRRGAGSLVGRISEELKAIKAECHSTRARLFPHLGSNVCYYLIPYTAARGRLVLELDCHPFSF